VYVQLSVDIETFFYEQLQTVNMAAICCRVDWALARQTDGPLSGDGDEGPQSTGTNTAS
jgi:hypothetical protein